MHTTIGQRLLAARTARGLSARSLSVGCGASHYTVRLIESGEIAKPNVELISAIAAKLDVPLLWLATGTGPAPDLDAAHAPESPQKDTCAQESSGAEAGKRVA